MNTFAGLLRAVNTGCPIAAAVASPCIAQYPRLSICQSFG